MKKSINDIDVRNRRVLVRADFNVPLHSGRVADDLRIRRTLPTIQYLLEHNAQIILCSHLGRPKGKIVEHLRLDPVAERLAVLLGEEVVKADECIGLEAASLADALNPGEIMMLENIRFDPGEEANDPDFAAELADMADVFVNDAFATAHRAHASTVGVTEYLPSAAGLLMQREIRTLEEIRSNPPRPYVAIFGGAKISDKIEVIEKLLPQIDHLVVGGAMANTFLKARDLAVGQSLIDAENLQNAKRIMQLATRKLLLPVDVVITRDPQRADDSRTVFVRAIPDKWHIADVGPYTVEMIMRILADARLVIWNGPLGIMEISHFAKGTNTLAGVLAGLEDTVTVVGGGDSLSCVSRLGLEDRLSHVSTGGGAFLDFMAGKTLPGIAALEDMD
jgi:phosphoglycerate kinase